MTIKLTALDTLFFRDGKPFDKGDETWASGLFPPAPSVFYGSLRSAYIAQNSDKYSISNLITKTEDLRIRQISFKVHAQITGTDDKEWGQYFPLPRDLVIQKTVNDNETYQRKKYKVHKTYRLQVPTQPSSNYSNATLLALQSPFNNEEIETLDNGVIHSLAFQKYLRGDKEPYFEGRELDKFLTHEPKVGIGRDNHTHTASEGLLYRVGMQRPEYIQIIIDFQEVKGLTLAPTGFLKLGGEGKTVAYQLDNSLEVTFKKTRLSDNEEYFKLYLASPALFEKGWYPTEIFKKANIEVELITAALGKTVNIGGFDMVQRKPKPMLKAIPAGSVYYYKLKSGSLERLFNAIVANSISEIREREGFGIAYLAKI
jgi:CRISPR-associated protein Cmr3